MSPVSEQDQPAPVPSEEEIAAELERADAEDEAGASAQGVGEYIGGAPDAASGGGEVPPAGESEPNALVDRDLDGDVGVAESQPEERRYPSTIGGAFYLLVLVATAVGVGIVTTGDWRLGIRCVGGALAFAALSRLVLPARDAGMLAVRNRFVDCFLLAGLGAALFFLAATIPNQPS